MMDASTAEAFRQKLLDIAHKSGALSKKYPQVTPGPAPVPVQGQTTNNPTTGGQ